MSLRILLADDHPVVRIGVRSVIEAHEAGKVVAEAGTVDELLALLAEQVFDILVTDLSMPGPLNPDGYAMIERICRNHPDLPVGWLRLPKGCRGTCVPLGASGTLQALCCTSFDTHHSTEPNTFHFVALLMSRGRYLGFADTSKSEPARR